MKKRIAMLMTILMTIVCVCPAGLALDPANITVTITDKDGNVHTETYTGDSFDSDQLDSYLSTLSPADMAKVKEATVQQISASIPDSDTGPYVIIGTNANGEPVTIEIKSDVAKLQTEDSPTVTLEGDVKGKDSNPAVDVMKGDPSITVNGDVNVSKDIAIQVTDTGDEAQITVIGDVTAPNGSGIAAMNTGETEITVDGSVKVAYTGVNAGGEAIIETGDVISTGGTAVSAAEQASVTVNGKVEAQNEGIIAADDATVIVHEDVTSQTRVGVDASDNSSVEVDGSVQGKTSAIVTDGEAEVTVHGDASSEGTTIQARMGAEYNPVTGAMDPVENHSTVTVEGNVTGNTGIYAENDANITVKGNVDGEDNAVRVVDAVDFAGESHATGAQVTVEGNVESDGTAIFMNASSEKALVQVDGNVISEGSGIIAVQSGKVDIGKDVTANGTGINAQGTTDVTVGGNVNAQFFGVSASDQAKVTVAGNVDTAGLGIVTSGESSVEVTGNVDAKGTGIAAHGESSVKVTGSVSSQIGSGVQTDGDATVQVHGDVESERTGVLQQDGGEITVDGSITAKGDGVEARTSGEVTVHGDITAGHVEKITTSSGYEYESPIGAGVNAAGTAIVTVDGNVQAERTGIVTMEEAKVTVHGDVTGKKANGVSADGQSIVTVDGNVTGNWSAVNANMDAEVTIRGDANGTVNASDQARVTVEKDVTDEDAGVYASHDAEVNILGSVNVDGRDMTEADAVGISATAGIDGFDPETWKTIPYDGNPTVTVGGDVTVQDGIGIQMDGRARVTVQGDVTAATAEDKEEEVAAPESNSYKAYQEAHEAAYADVEETEQTMGAVMIDLDENHDGQLIVGGTVRAGDQSVPIVISYHVDEDYSKATEMPELPEMKIYEIAPNNGEYFDVNVMLDREVSGSYVNEGTTEEQNFKFTETNVCVAVSEEDRAALVEAVAAAIEYIIRVDPEMKSSIQIADDFYDSENDLYAAHENEDVSVTLKLDGYDLTATGNYTLLDNGDGTWTLTVQRGGGVTLSAVIKKSGSPAAAGGPSAADAEADAGWRDSRVGKKVLFGRYDLDGNGEKEDLEWIVLRVADGSARLATARGMEAIPADFDTAFNEEEAGQIRTEITPLDRVMSKSFFGDGMVHASMYVNLAALHLD